MRATVLLLVLVGFGVAGLSAADPPQATSDSTAAAPAVHRLTQKEAIQLALVEAYRLNLDLRDVGAQSAASHTTEAGTTWYVYFQRKVDYTCAFVIAIDDRTGKAEPDIRKC